LRILREVVIVGIIFFNCVTATNISNITKPKYILLLNENKKDGEGISRGGKKRTNSPT
jgi:hypothetical protein